MRWRKEGVRKGGREGERAREGGSEEEKEEK